MFSLMQFLKSQPNVFAVKYWAGNQFTVNGIPDILACINGQFHGIASNNSSISF
jgi:hypothetical protein